MLAFRRNMRLTISMATVISKLQDVKDTVQQKGRKGSDGAASRLGPFEKGDKGADDPHARA
jgi:hypothetical protein